MVRTVSRRAEDRSAPMKQPLFSFPVRYRANQFEQPAMIRIIIKKLSGLRTSFIIPQLSQKGSPAGCSLFYKRTNPSSCFQPEGQTKSPPRYAWQATWNYNQSPRYFKSCTKYWPDCRSRSSRSRSRLPKITKPLSP